MQLTSETLIIQLIFLTPTRGGRRSARGPGRPLQDGGSFAKEFGDFRVADSLVSVKQCAKFSQEVLNKGNNMSPLDRRNQRIFWAVWTSQEMSSSI
ncbi:SRA stem-loop-interacting RNA-binding protein, mitochondrial isoform X2 [Chiloscyllium punctatum]|uniref:SRA stem-loop-interacting RNA-binding protein, mitochondrial isoform X2 n=1 Tax=Chiloscyllium punctatum TaxID=137246 RepID=UPI003B639F46